MTGKTHVFLAAGGGEFFRTLTKLRDAARKRCDFRGDDGIRRGLQA